MGFYCSIGPLPMQPKNAPIPSNSTELNVMSEALAVLDVLEAEHAPILDEGARRARLIELVSQVSQKQGNTYPLETIARIVDQRQAERDLPVVIPESKPIGPSRWHRLGTRLINVGPNIGHWWSSRRHLTRQLIGGVSISAALALVLVLTPWIAVFRAPFLLSAHHLGLFIGAWIFVLGALLTTANACEHSHENISGASWISFILVILIGAFGCLPAHMTAHSDTDVRSLQYGMKWSSTAMAQAHAKLASGATFSDTVTTANAIVHADGTTRLSTVGEVDMDRQIIQRSADLNPEECVILKANPDKVFHVVSVNGKPATDADFACPYTWDNSVVLETLPGQVW